MPVSVCGCHGVHGKKPSKVTLCLSAGERGGWDVGGMEELIWSGPRGWIWSGPGGWTWSGPGGWMALRRVASVHCVHYIGEKDCKARFATGAIWEITDWKLNQVAPATQAGLYTVQARAPPRSILSLWFAVGSTGANVKSTKDLLAVQYVKQKQLIQYCTVRNIHC